MKNEINSLTSKMGGNCNTPPQYSNNNQIQACFDWFRLSWKDVKYNCADLRMEYLFDENSLSSLIELVKILNPTKSLFDYQIENNFINRYRFKIVMDEGVTILLYGSLSENIPVTGLEITGTGMNLLVKKFGVSIYKKLFDFALKYDFNNGRLDPAIDIYDSAILDHNYFLNKIQKKEYVSLWKKYSLTTSQMEDYNDLGWTLILGSPTSDIKMRYYNKNAERKAKDKNVLIDKKYHYRMELEITSKDKIKEIFQNFIINFENDDFDCSKFFSFIAKIFGDCICLKTPNCNEHNKSKWKIDSVWYLFLKSIENIKSISLVKNRSTIEKKTDWFSRSCFKTLCQLYFCFGEDEFFKYLKNGIINSFNDFTKIEFEQIKNYFLSNGIESEFIDNNDFCLEKFEKFIRKLEDKKICTIH